MFPFLLEFVTKGPFQVKAFFDRVKGPSGWYLSFAKAFKRVIIKFFGMSHFKVENNKEIKI